jgi:hypothetical protein
VSYQDHVEVVRRQRPDLAAELAGFTSVSSVLRWIQARGLAGTKVDIIAQDEFEYDFLIRLGPDDEWLAFGLT